MLIKYRCVCIQSLIFLKHKHHVWRRGSNIEPTDSTPKGSEGISDVISKEISEAFPRENFVTQAQDRRNS